MADYYTLTGNLGGFMPPGTNPASLVAVVTTNLDGPVVDTAGNRVALGDVDVPVQANGDLSVSLLPTDSADTNVSGWSYWLNVGYRTSISKVDGRGATRDVARLGPFPLTKNSTLAELSVHFDTPAVDPTWRDGFRDEMETLRDETAAISGLGDVEGAVILLDANPASPIRVQQDARLSTTIGSEIETDGTPARAALNAATSALVAQVNAQQPITAYKFGDSLLVRTQFSSTRDILIPVSLNGPSGVGAPTRVVFITASHPAVYTVPKTALDSQVWPTVDAGLSPELIHVPNDDNAPIVAESYYTGGNHGYTGGGVKITVTTHGKTNIDRGSQWSDGTNTFTLAKVIDANNMLFLHAYQDLSAGRSRLVLAQPATTLTHVSGATNTTSIPVTTKTAMDLPEVVHSRTVDTRLDGFPMVEGTMTGQALTITESYTLPTFKEIVVWSRANVGGDPFAEASLKAASAVGLCRLTTSYRITGPGQTVVQQTMSVLSPFSARMGVTQATALQVPAGGTLRQFMPGVGTVGGFNLSTYADVTTVGGNVNIALANQLTAADPATRMIQWAHDSGGSRKWGHAVGVLPLVDGKRAARRSRGTDTRSWFFSTLKKNYPQIAWDPVLTAGQSLTGIAYRRYLPPDAPPELLLEDSGRQWVIIDRPDANATEQAARVPKALGRAVVPDGTATVALSTPTVPGLEVGYTNTAPGYLLGEAVPPG